MGRHIAMKMAENRCNLFLTSTNAVKLKRYKKELESRYGKDINIFYKSGVMALISTEKEGWDLIKELKEKGRITGDKWTVEKNIKELEDKIVYIDQRGNLYNFKENK